MDKVQKHNSFKMKRIFTSRHRNAEQNHNINIINTYSDNVVQLSAIRCSCIVIL
jgi:hypothetical protein